MKAAKWDGITKEALSVHLMQQDKFETNAKCIRSPDKKMATPNNLAINSPVGMHKGTAEYYKAKLENAQEVIVRLNTSAPLFQIGLLTIKKVTPNKNYANVRVTQVHTSMEGKGVLALATKIKEDKELKEKTCKDSI